LLKALRETYAGHALLVSVTTETGHAVLSKFSEPDLCIYFPFDFMPAVRASLGTVNPRLIIIMETEIWPNFTHEAARRDIPLFLVNGRISDRSSTRYQTFDWFFRESLARFSLLCMQTDTDSQRIVAIGAPKERTMVCGNLKYDIPWGQVTAEERNRLRRQYGIPEQRLVVVAASTHPGEEELLLPLWKKLAQERGDLQLALVPRHPERAADVATLLEKHGLACRRRTSLTGNTVLAPGQVLLVDTVGELMQLYALSDLAFVGGSLVPTGGHNLLEPASRGIPVIFGPFMANFREITAMTLQYGAGVQVNDTDELATALYDFLKSPELRQVIGANGLKMLRDSGGATGRIMEQLAHHL
jgi:3-deoxy-D-manno-octulosonic-acid transferase